MPNYTASHPGWFATMDSWPIILAGQPSEKIVNLPLSTCLLFSADSIITHTYSMITMVPLLHAQARLDHDTLCRPFARMRLNSILHNFVDRHLDYARDSNHSFDRTVRNDFRVSSVKGLVCSRRSTTNHTIVESKGHNPNHRRRRDGAHQYTPEVHRRAE